MDEQRRPLVLALRGTQAHMGFEDALVGFPAWAINLRPPNVGYTPWHLVEHLRITQWDILRYIEDPTGHLSPEWPVATGRRLMRRQTPTASGRRWMDSEPTWACAVDGRRARRADTELGHKGTVGQHSLRSGVR